jgi:hypothetical protein
MAANSSTGGVSTCGKRITAAIVGQAFIGRNTSAYTIPNVSQGARTAGPSPQSMSAACQRIAAAVICETYVDALAFAVAIFAESPAAFPVVCPSQDGSAVATHRGN